MKRDTTTGRLMATVFTPLALAVPAFLIHPPANDNKSAQAGQPVQVTDAH